MKQQPFSIYCEKFGLVVVGGWVPDLLISEVEEVHVGSIDVDLALDAQKLNDGRYAELLKVLFQRNGTSRTVV